MSKIHQREARRLLPILYRTARNGAILTYQSAARELGRDPNKNARTVGQICNLLDAAAVWANVPLLALFYVRDASLEINRKAFPRPLSNAIVEKARRHTFTEADVQAIKHALDDLGAMGGIKAWAFVRDSLPHQELHRRLTEPENADGGTDAINDIASDSLDEVGSDTPPRVTATTQHYLRDERIRKAVLRRARGRCEFCGNAGFLRQDGSAYLETHHIIALANDGADRMTNVIALCANDHRKAHFGRNGANMERRMISIVEKLEGGQS